MSRDVVKTLLFHFKSIRYSGTSFVSLSPSPKHSRYNDIFITSLSRKKPDFFYIINVEIKDFRGKPAHWKYLWIKARNMILIAETSTT